MFLFFLQHEDSQEIPAWTGFNQSTSDVNPEPTTVGFLPIIQAPAHELDTMMSVLLRCKSIAEHLNQSHVVLTLDEALYWRAKELVWANSDLNNFVIRLGGFHIAKNFLAVIGKHMEKSGSSDL